MGSGAIVSKNNSYDLEKNDNQVELHFRIRHQNIIDKNGEFYCMLNRDEYKLSNQVLLAMEMENNFSIDSDDI